MYYVIVGKKNKSMIVTRDFEEASDFIIENRDAKISTIDHTKKVKIMDKRLFLMDYYKSLENKDRFFEMVKIMVKGSINQNNLVTLLGLRKEYLIYKHKINVNF